VKSSVNDVPQFLGFSVFVEIAVEALAGVIPPVVLGSAFKGAGAGTATVPLWGSRLTAAFSPCCQGSALTWPDASAFAAVGPLCRATPAIELLLDLHRDRAAEMPGVVGSVQTLLLMLLLRGE
jgi:hypothetical protein